MWLEWFVCPKPGIFSSMQVFPVESTKQPPYSMTEQSLAFIELLIYLEAYFPKTCFNSFSHLSKRVPTWDLRPVIEVGEYESLQYRLC